LFGPDGRETEDVWFVALTLAQWAAWPELKDASLNAGLSRLPDGVSVLAELVGDILDGEESYGAPGLLQMVQEQPIAFVRPLISARLGW
jgi:hypothetical protein